MGEMNAMRKNKRNTNVELTREAGKSRLTVYTWQNMKSKLLWSLHDDMFAGRVPPNHMVILRTL
jgi:hypothetical protein